MTMCNTEKRTRTTRWCRDCGYRVEDPERWSHGAGCIPRHRAEAVYEVTETYKVVVPSPPINHEEPYLCAVLAGRKYGP